jgi:hypothetical protein
MKEQQIIKAEREEGKLPDVYKSNRSSYSRSWFTGSKYDIDLEELKIANEKKLAASNTCEQQGKLF